MQWNCDKRYWQGLNNKNDVQSNRPCITTPNPVLRKKMKDANKLIRNYEKLLKNDDLGDFSVDDELSEIKCFFSRPRTSELKATHFYGGFALFGLMLAIVFGFMIYFQGKSSSGMIQNLMETNARLEAVSRHVLKDRNKLKNQMVLVGIEVSEDGMYSVDPDRLALYLSENEIDLPDFGR